MRYSRIDNDLFIRNRQRFARRMPANAIAVFHSNDVMPTNADGTRPFIQDSNMFWLTGIDQEESICILYPDAREEKYREMLFLRKTNEQIAIWEGHKYSKDDARSTSGIDNVFWMTSFLPMIKRLMSEVETVLIPTEYHPRQNIVLPDANVRFAHWCKEHFPLHVYRDASRITHPLRLVKNAEEVELIRNACDITEAGFRRVLHFVKPGVWEFEVEAEYAHEFIRRRARGFAYEPIVGSGANSCILHYIENDHQCLDGDVLLMDVGASYANYAADMSRTIPVNGRFTKRQRQVYDAVHRAFNKSKKLLTPGTLPKEYDAAVAEIVEEELVHLGLISMQEIREQDSNKPAYTRYFMHKVSHSLGLDVHDVGDRHLPFEAGMVFTCEPGIYIPEEQLGIRIENDILITENGNIDLMANIPIDAEEIEELMNA